MDLSVGPARYNSVRQNAYRSNLYIDGVLKSDVEQACSDVSKHLQDCINNPTVGLIARNESKSRSISAYKRLRNIDEIFVNRKVAKLDDQFQVVMNKMYPKTQAIRRALVKANRFEFGRTLPKMSEFEKLLFRIKYFVAL